MSPGNKDGKNHRQNQKPNSASKDKSQRNEEKFPGYPSYPQDDDIYSREKEETDLDPENPTKMKAPNEDPDAPNERNPMNDITGGDLDVPGSELDDEQESVGSEDEENNYYSLGGDEKESNEEDQG